MGELRHSIWSMMIEQLRAEISDAGDLEKWSVSALRDELVKATMKLPSIGSAVMNNLVPFGFEPGANGEINKSVYENYTNVETEYYLGQVNDTALAYCETKAFTFPGKQVILLVPYFVWEAGGGTAPVLDVSLNKDPSNGEELRGTFLADDGRIDTITSGTKIDTSMIPSSSFSFKWSFAANSGYKIKETLFEVMTADMLRLRDEMGNIVLMAAANIYQMKISAAQEKGVGGQFIEGLQRRYETLIGEVRGNVGKGVSLTSKVDAVDGIDRSFYADKAFSKRRTGLDGQWVEITGNEITGRRVRIVLD